MGDSTPVPALKGNRLSRIAVYELVIDTPGPDARLLVVAAHPDDETLGAGMLLQRYRNLAIVHVTDGAPRNMEDAVRCGFDTAEAYGAQRRQEFKAALLVLGAAHAELVALNVPDQEATARVFEVITELRRIVAQFRPTLLLTHPYEGGHPDHDACAFAVHRAARSLPVWEFTSYHSDEGRLRAGHFLGRDPGAVTLELTGEEQATKRHAIHCFATQSEMLAQFPITHESFRPAPAYDFTQPPHAGPLLYEQFDWGMTGERFRATVRGFL